MTVSQTQIQLPSATPPAKPLKWLDFTALWALYLLTLRQYQHGKRWMVLAALALLPIGLAFLVRCTATKVPSLVIEFVFAFMFIPQAMLPLIGLVYSSGLITDEQEDQTLSYLLVRPIPKWALYLTKLLATLTIAMLLTFIFTFLTFAVIYVGPRHGHF